MDEQHLEDLEIRLLLEGVCHRYGYDFRDYAPASLKRRVRAALREEQVGTVSALQEKVLHDPACLERLVATLTVSVTAMFRDPTFYLALRTQVVPYLRTYPFLRLWHAGCATGEEVYSLAIVLTEEGLYDRCKLYATDISEAALRRAKSGIFPLQAMQEYTTNYLAGGGQRSFSEYYTAQYDHALFRPALQKNLVFAAHNLATDASFNEFQVILCRNVLIYFNKRLQGRAHQLLYESLATFGVLALGAKESLKFTPYEDRYEVVDGREKLYRKVR